MEHFRLARPLLPATATEVHMVIEELDPAAAPEWDDYVARKEGANCYHLHGWRTAGERGYGLRAPFLAARARQRGELLGVLPLFFVRSSPLRGYATTGLFGAYGPVLADDSEISGLLLREACRRARDAGLASLRFKGLGDEPGARGFVPLDHWVVARLPLWSSPDQAWAAIRGKERNLVRKAREHGLEVRRGSDQLPAFYDALAANMHHKGAPIYGQRWIEEVVRSFGEAAEVVTVHHRGRCVAGAVTLTFKGVITVPFLSARPEALPLRPNVLLVWDLIARGCGQGLGTLDLGTSLRGSSSLSFKLHWGCRVEPRSILVCPLRGGPPALDVQSPMVRAGVALWQRLPRAWADALGPQVCRRFLA
jgi:FemAB-related protein (PEP-CTERM system-associated)